MVYCKKCNRLLDDDVQFCPICGDEDEKFKKRQESEDKMKVLNDHIEEQEQERKNVDAPPLYPPPQSAPQNPPPFPVKPPPVPLPPPMYRDRPQGAVSAEYADKPSSGLYAGMVILAIFVSVGGLIAGIVYMTNKNPEYKKMGITTLIISIVSMVVQMVCCCAVFYASMPGINDFWY